MNYGPVWNWFGLSYSSYLVLPRTLLCGMPEDWQERMVALLEEMQDTYDSSQIEDKYTVKLRGVTAVDSRRTHLGIIGTHQSCLGGRSKMSAKYYRLRQKHLGRLHDSNISSSEYEDSTAILDLLDERGKQALRIDELEEQLHCSLVSEQKAHEGYQFYRPKADQVSKLGKENSQLRGALEKIATGLKVHDGLTSKWMQWVATEALQEKGEK